MYFTFMLSIIFGIIIRVKTSEELVRTIAQWRYFDYAWNSNEEKEEYQSQYDFSRIVPIDIDVDAMSK